MLREIVHLSKGVILITGDAKKIARIFLNAWLSNGMIFLAEHLPFDVKYPENVFIGSLNEGIEFDGYLIYNLLSRPKNERAKIYEWIKEYRDKLILIYETKYMKDSVLHYGIKELINYLIAYKRETLGFERIDVYKFEEGRVIEKKSYVRRS
ncbi:hypothetical protein E3E31_03090 [Thermococcus sp. M39]|uniref:hypothetical protein n=1 Tax=unclassified Thermococcus TaxID=2627626 RepID=UPI00143CA6D3|nr:MULTISPECIES: hypothetical protein [unclassified Thermococcus]NJE07518.1 hypothetical protein [Thermococcus sp. M39]NJE12098.1 hypothetical protein [Thermococcus sp. LS2]